MESVKSTTATAGSLSRTQTENRTRAGEKGVDTWFNSQAIKFEQWRFGWMTILLTIQSCLGAVACMYILQNNASVVQLGVCAAITMGSNAVFIAQGSGKWCLGAFYLSILLNTIFIIMNV